MLAGIDWEKVREKVRDTGRDRRVDVNIEEREEDGA
jgi:hypothetical protein